MELTLMHLCSKCIKPQPDIKREGEGAKFIFETIIMIVTINMNQ